MSRLRRLVLVRHGETVGNSSVRFHGSNDVELSAEGRALMREVGRGLRGEVFELVVASPLRRSWEAASIVVGGAPVRLEHDFREIHFGRWEGLTREEIEATDPVLFKDWQEKTTGFDFPGGEPRAEFQARVLRGLERLEQSGARSALIVVHKGTIRTIADRLLGEPLAEGEPPLGGAVALSRGPDGSWVQGRRSSNRADPQAAA
jgi:broad specificity phosphatase PhoE